MQDLRKYSLKHISEAGKWDDNVGGPRVCGVHEANGNDAEVCRSTIFNVTRH